MLSLLFLFVLVEFYPSLITNLNIFSIPYLKNHERYILDPELIYKMRSNYHLTADNYIGDQYSGKLNIKAKGSTYAATYNDIGFRLGCNAKKPDVVTIGDSFFEFGFNDEDLFCNYFANITGTNVDNYALGGYGPHQYLKLFERYAKHKGPRTVLIGFFEGNDLHDLANYLIWKQSGYYYDIYFGASFLEKFFYMSREIIGLFVNRLSKTILKRDQRILRPLVDVTIAEEEKKMIFTYLNPCRLEDRQWSNSIIELERIFAKLSEQCNKTGIHLVILYIPTKARVYSEIAVTESSMLWAQTVESFNLRKGEQESVVSAICNKLGITFLSLSGQFINESKNKLLYNQFDTHWNSDGKKIAAQIVADFLKESEIIR